MERRRFAVGVLPAAGTASNRDGEPVRRRTGPDEAGNGAPHEAEFDAADAPTERRRRGWISLHAAAFALVLVSGLLVVLASLRKLDESGLSLLRASWWVSGAAIVVAVASVLVPQRRS